MPCRFNHRRIWAHRMMLEAGEHEENTFVTLTYEDEFLPEYGSVSPLDLRLFMDRLRKAYLPNRVRFFAVGEYGDKTWRPHYHLALFGYPNCSWGNTRHSFWEKHGFCCDACGLIREKWNRGHVHLGTLEEYSAQYIAGYVTKKMTKKNDPRLDFGMHPEFMRCSNRPYGIGASAMHDVAATILKHGLDDRLGDVPRTLVHGNQHLPLGRYLVDKLRKYSGMDTLEVKQYARDKAQEKVLELRVLAKLSEENPSVAGQHKAAFFQSLASFEKRTQIYTKGRYL